MSNPVSNIDFSRVLTAQDQTTQANVTHGAVVKRVCKRRILAHLPFEAQQNIAQAVAFYAAENVRRANGSGVSDWSELSDDDFKLAGAARHWVAAMQEACRTISEDPQADPEEEALWPPLPDGVAALVSRF